MRGYPGSTDSDSSGDSSHSSSEPEPLDAGANDPRTTSAKKAKNRRQTKQNATSLDEADSAVADDLNAANAGIVKNRRGVSPIDSRLEPPNPYAFGFLEVEHTLDKICFGDPRDLAALTGIKDQKEMVAMADNAVRNEFESCLWLQDRRFFSQHFQSTIS